jgi:glutathione S-transferase
MSPTLKLYAIQGSCALAPHILLRESALPFTTQIWSQAEIKKNGGMPSELLAINPKGKVPCLQVDDEVVTEGVAIMTYISQLAGAEKGLFGKGPMETVRCYEWLGYLASTLHAVGFGTCLISF